MRVLANDALKMPKFSQLKEIEDNITFDTGM